MAEANLTSTPRKSQTLPPNTHLSPVSGSSSTSNGNFLTKIKKIFRINSKGKYDLATTGVHVKSRKKNDEHEEGDFKKRNLTTRSSSVRVMRNSRLDKEEVVLLSKGQILIKDSQQIPISSSCASNGDSLNSSVAEEMENVFEEPGYESLDEIRQKVVSHCHKLNSKTSEKLLATSREGINDKQTKTLFLNKNSFCAEHVVDEGSRDSGLGSPRPEDRESGNHARSATSSLFSETTVSIDEQSIEMRDTDVNKLFIRPNSCPWTKESQEIPNKENVHHSQLVFSESKSPEIDDSLYANSSILIRKKSKYQSDKSITRETSVTLSANMEAQLHACADFKPLPQKCASENNLTNQKLSVTRATSETNANSIPPPLPQRQYSKAEVDYTTEHSGTNTLFSRQEEEIEKIDQPFVNHACDDSSFMPDDSFDEIRKGFSIYEDIDSTRLSVKALAEQDTTTDNSNAAKSDTYLASQNHNLIQSDSNITEYHPIMDVMSIEVCNNVQFQPTIDLESKIESRDIDSPVKENDKLTNNTTVIDSQVQVQDEELKINQATINLETTPTVSFQQICTSQSNNLKSTSSYYESEINGCESDLCEEVSAKVSVQESMNHPHPIKIIKYYTNHQLAISTNFISNPNISNNGAILTQGVNGQEEGVHEHGTDRPAQSDLSDVLCHSDTEQTSTIHSELQTNTLPSSLQTGNPLNLIGNTIDTTQSQTHNTVNSVICSSECLPKSADVVDIKDSMLKTDDANARQFNKTILIFPTTSSSDLEIKDENFVNIQKELKIENSESDTDDTTRIPFTDFENSNHKACVNDRPISYVSYDTAPASFTEFENSNSKSDVNNRPISCSQIEVCPANNLEWNSELPDLPPSHSSLNNYVSDDTAQASFTEFEYSNNKSGVNDRPISCSQIEVCPANNLEWNSELPYLPDLPPCHSSPNCHVKRELIHVTWSELHNKMNNSSVPGGADVNGDSDDKDLDNDDEEDIDPMTESIELKRRDFLENMRQLRDCGWYWGPLSYEEAEAKLTNKPDGSFLVRDSSNENYILSLSFICGNMVRHTRIEHNKGLFSFWSQPDSHGKETIKEFIEKTVENSKNGNFHYFLRPPGPGMPPMPIQLIHPISRFVKFRSLQHMCRFLILRWVRRDHVDSLPVPEKVKNYLRENQYYVESLEED